LKKVLNFKLILLLFFLSGVYIILFSESGYLERRKHREKINELEKRVMDLKDENVRLNRLYEFYRKGGLTEEDLLRAGYVKKGEKVIFIKGKLPVNEARKKREPGEENPVSIGNLRIAWIFISAVVFIIYLYSRTGVTGEQQ
jgi:cell division protein FtsB